MSLLITTPHTSKYENWREAFAQIAPDLKVVCGAEQASEEVTYVLTWHPPKGLFQSLPNLRAVFSMGAGVDHITSDPSLPNVPLIRQRDAGMGTQMSEYALYAALHYQRDFDIVRLNQQSQTWAPFVSGVRPRLNIGILGLGTLGSVVANALVQNGFPVSGWSRSKKEVDGVTSYSGEGELGDFLAQTELLLCLLPDTEQTRGMVNQNLLQQLPKGAVLVNVARGALVNDDELLQAIDSGHLRGAMLDVFHIEPLPTEHRFWSHPNIVVTPHVAAETVYAASAQQVSLEIQRMEAGLPPTEVVDPSRGY